MACSAWSLPEAYRGSSHCKHLRRGAELRARGEQRQPWGHGWEPDRCRTERMGSQELGAKLRVSLKKTPQHGEPPTHHKAEQNRGAILGWGIAWCQWLPGWGWHQAEVPIAVDTGVRHCSPVTRPAQSLELGLCLCPGHSGAAESLKISRGQGRGKALSAQWVYWWGRGTGSGPAPLSFPVSSSLSLHSSTAS